MVQATNKFLAEQIEYYRARASEYDNWFLRRGRYDYGIKQNKQWFDDVDELKAQLKLFQPQGHVLELACGTGLWTRELLQYVRSITAVDAAPEVLALNRAQITSKQVTFVQADIFTWKPTQTYDIVFFSFWLSHVPDNKFTAFWKLVEKSLKKNGRVFFIDNRNSSGGARNSVSRNDYAKGLSVRTLVDGRTYTIIKNFYQPKDLASRLKKLGWKIRVSHTKHFFIYGFGQQA